LRWTIWVKKRKGKEEVREGISQGRCGLKSCKIYSCMICVKLFISTMIREVIASSLAALKMSHQQHTENLHDENMLLKIKLRRPWRQQSSLH
jgi:hypothetical protein